MTAQHITELEQSFVVHEKSIKFILQYVRIDKDM
jgi:hypothetical protein